MMSNLDLSQEAALDLLQKARFELERCKKSLAFKENLLLELEFEVSDLTRKNQELQKEIDHQRLQDHRKKSLEKGGPAQEAAPDLSRSWSTESSRSSKSSGKAAGETKPSVPCESCRLSDIERNDLMNTIEELQDQKERLFEANQRLLQNLNSKAAQLDEIVADVSKEKALRRTLEQSVEFLTVEKELIERDLRDYRESTLPFARLSEVTNRGLSLGSSLGDELGLDDGRTNFGERKHSLPFNWDVDIERSEMTCFPERESNAETKEGSFPNSGSSTGGGDGHNMGREGAKDSHGQPDAHGEHCSAQESRAGSNSEDDFENRATNEHRPSTTFGWRSLMCVPYRRFVKRRRRR